MGHRLTLSCCRPEDQVRLGMEFAGVVWNDCEWVLRLFDVPLPPAAPFLYGDADTPNIVGVAEFEAWFEPCCRVIERLRGGWPQIVRILGDGTSMGETLGFFTWRRDGYYVIPGRLDELEVVKDSRDHFDVKVKNHKALVVHLPDDQTLWRPVAGRDGRMEHHEFKAIFEGTGLSILIEDYATHFAPELAAIRGLFEHARATGHSIRACYS